MKTAWVGSGVPVMATVSVGVDAAATHAASPCCGRC